jgi:cyanate permease
MFFALGGLSFGIAAALDAVSLFFWELSFLAAVLGKLFALQQKNLLSMLRLFLGKKGCFSRGCTDVRDRRQEAQFAAPSY